MAVYKFKSNDSGDVIMLSEHGDMFLRLIGREPADQGVIEPEAQAAAMQALEAAIAAEEGDADEEGPKPIALRRRLWPMLDMLRRAQAGKVRVVWGV